MRHETLKNDSQIILFYLFNSPISELIKSLSPNCFIQSNLICLLIVFIEMSPIG